MFGAFIDSNYLVALEINDTTGTARYTSYLDLHISSAEEGRVVRPKPPDKFSEILFIYLDMRDFNYIYFICRCCLSVLHIDDRFPMGNLKSSLSS
jgi:hypothetical protein